MQSVVDDAGIRYETFPSGMHLHSAAPTPSHFPSLLSPHVLISSCWRDDAVSSKELNPFLTLIPHILEQTL